MPFFNSSMLIIPPFAKGGARGDFARSLNPPQSPFFKGGSFY
ncbi:hypothetical protein HPS_0059 [Glaesserella parasuis 29755]|nr:hypothetical protein HPS_0059 [Glaesserella parasuis 29755]